MKTIKTSELTGAALDWAVARCEGIPAEELYIQKWGSRLSSSIYRRNRDEDGKLDGSYTTGPDLLFSRKWEAGGPIVEREGINVGRHEWMGPSMEVISWSAERYATEKPGKQIGPTPLIAAMRCYVASKLGGEIEVPEELV